MFVYTFFLRLQGHISELNNLVGPSVQMDWTKAHLKTAWPLREGFRKRSANCNELSPPAHGLEAVNALLSSVTVICLPFGFLHPQRRGRMISKRWKCLQSVLSTRCSSLPSPSLLRPRGINSPQERKAAKRQKVRGACFWQNQPEREREGRGLWLTPHLCLEATQSGHCCAASCPRLALVQGLCSGLELPYAASFGRRRDLVMLLLPATTDS